MSVLHSLTDEYAKILFQQRLMMVYYVFYFVFAYLRSYLWILAHYFCFLTHHLYYCYPIKCLLYRASFPLIFCKIIFIMWRFFVKSNSEYTLLQNWTFWMEKGFLFVEYEIRKSKGKLLRSKSWSISSLHYQRREFNTNFSFYYTPLFF